MGVKAGDVYAISFSFFLVVLSLYLLLSFHSVFPSSSFYPCFVLLFSHNNSQLTAHNIPLATCFLLMREHVPQTILTISLLEANELIDLVRILPSLDFTVDT